MPVVTVVAVPVGKMKMRGPVTPFGAAAEQAAAENLLALASSLLAGGYLYLVPLPGAAYKQAAAPAMLLVAEPPV